MSRQRTHFYVPIGTFDEGAIDEGEMIFERILDMISDAEKVDYNAAYILLDILNAEVNRFGYDAVVGAMGNAPEEFIEEAEDSLHYSDSDSRNPFRGIISLIEGTIMNADSMRAVGDIEFDSDGNY